MKRLILVLLWVVLGCSRAPEAMPPEATGGDEVTNGGGVAEKNAVFVFLNMSHFLAVCSKSELCAVGAEEKDLIARIQTALVDRPPQADQLVFISERQKPGTFKADGRSHGVVRSAVTRGRIGAPIWLNVDHLYQEGKSGALVPLDMPTLASLLLDELAHHVEPRFSDPVEHAKLDALCGRFRGVLGRYVQQLSGWPKWNGITVALLEDPELLVSDGVSTHSFTSLVAAEASCPERGQKVTGFKLQNLHWGKGGWDGFPHYTYYRVWVEGWLIVSCTEERPPASPMTVIYQNNLRLGFRIEAKYEGDALTHWTLPEKLNENIEVSP